jgi:phage/plasmid-like protein (TIGR03299 family)
MAHNLEIVDGEASFAYTGERPWHRLGTQVPGLMTTREAIVAGKLDWSVTKRELRTADEDALAIPGRFAIVRDDNKTVLGTVGRDYTTVQNVEAFAPFDEVLGPSNARIETVGALGRGERIFAMARLHDGAFEPAPGDPVEPFFLMTTAHDGSGCVSLVFTSVRVVCQNTLTAALRGARAEIRVKHTKGVHEGLKLAPKILAASQGYWTRLRETFTAMANRQADRARVRDFLKKLFPDHVNDDGEVVPTAHVLALREKVEALFDGGAVGADLAGSTDWGLFNAISDHIERGRRVPSDAWVSSVLGSGAGLRQRALDLLVSSAS